MSSLKAIRQGIRLSISALARQAGVSRFRLWSAEQGEITLTPEEQARIQRALRAEAVRIEGVFRGLENVSDAA